MTKDNIGKIGIDRTRFVLGEIMVDRNIYKMNIEEGNKAVILDMDTNEYIRIADFNLTIKGIALSEDDDYTIKIELQKKPCINFILDVNIPKLLYNSNENNANNLEHLGEINDIIEKKLLEVGVFTNMENARISNIEVNINSDDKKLYDAMALIKKGWSSANDKVFITENKDNIESLMIRNTYLKMKVYNKVKQLQDTSQLFQNDSLVRIEISTRHRKILENISGGKLTLKGVIENWDSLEKWFKDTVKRQVKKPCENFETMVVNEMIEQLKNGNKTYDVLITHAKQGNLVDLELFSRAMKKYYKETGKKSPSSIIKNTKKRLEKVDGKIYDEMTNNINALNNLWEILGI